MPTGISPELLVALSAVFVSVGILSAFGASHVLTRRSPDRRRLEGLIQPRKPGELIRVLDDPKQKSGPAKPLTTKVAKSPKDLGSLERRLTTAGFRHPAAAPIYTASEFVLPVVLAVPPLLFMGLEGGWMAALAGAAIGHLAPGTIVWRRIEKRKQEIQDGLPDALDLLVLCLEAGSSLDQAVVKASDELAISYPALADEFRTVTTETRAGKSRTEAFRNLADRSKVDDLRSLVAMLVQTDRFGTSIAQALRTHAEVGRTKRRQRAEERAGRVGVKLVFPLVLCMFPALYIVLLGPAVIDYMLYFRN
jgi:tight adherence protein C